jgi:hypothetical protein
LDNVKPVKPATSATMIEAKTRAVLLVVSKNSILVDGIKFQTNQTGKNRVHINLASSALFA